MTSKPKQTTTTQASLFTTTTIVKPSALHLDSARAAIETCKRCEISGHYPKKIYGYGNQVRPTIAFVGDAPTVNEVSSGKHFGGAGMELLTKILAAMKFVPEECFFMTCIACTPAQPRSADEVELLNCRDHLFGQLLAVAPHSVVALGMTAGNALLQSKKPLSLDKLRGKWHDWQGIPMRTTFSLAHLLKVPLDREYAWKDMQEVMSLLQKEL